MRIEKMDIKLRKLGKGVAACVATLTALLGSALASAATMESIEFSSLPILTWATPSTVTGTP